MSSCCRAAALASILWLAGCGGGTGTAPGEQMVTPGGPGVVITPEPPEPLETPDPVSKPLPAGIESLQVDGADFRDSDGQRVRFWGVNICSLFPTREQADGLARELAERGINLVRPHHYLRRSTDWSPQMTGGSLLTYIGNSRTPDPEAWERFDYLNAALREQGIYLQFSLHWTRQFRPGDADILATTTEDAAAWSAAIEEMMGYDWRRAFDLWKILPVVDERAYLLMEEFAIGLLEHRNPHTGLTYAEDPQVLTWELINEHSCEYIFICNNRLPTYFDQGLQARWQAYAAERGMTVGSFYDSSTRAERDLRARFFRQLDADFTTRMRAVLERYQVSAPVCISNLWFGEQFTALNAELGDYVESHTYSNPQVAATMDDFFWSAQRNAVVGKPFMMTEINHGEGAENKALQAPQRMMMPLAIAAYGSLQNWAGLAWFAWLHGDRNLAADGSASTADRDSHLGNIQADNCLLDHFRTASTIFRRGYLADSSAPIIIDIDTPTLAGNYNELVGRPNRIQAGWPNVHQVRRRFGQGDSDTTADWFQELPANPVCSDTGEICKDVDRQQLTISNAYCEAFGGQLDGTAPALLRRLVLQGEGFVTVLLVSDDGLPLKQALRLRLSRSWCDATGANLPGEPIRLHDLGPGPWRYRITRPETGPWQAIAPDGNGQLLLPTDWFELELERLEAVPLSVAQRQADGQHGL